MISFITIHYPRPTISGLIYLLLSDCENMCVVKPKCYEADVQCSLHPLLYAQNCPDADTGKIVSIVT